MSEWSFTPAQADHALEVVLKLMQTRRYFLSQQSREYPDPGYNLDLEIFAPAHRLDENIRAIYAEVRALAEEEISRREAKLGIVPPDPSNFSNGKQLVQCNRYTGGLDIVGVYPLSNFADCIPESHQALEDEIYQVILGSKSEDDYSSNSLREFHSLARMRSNRIWSEIVDLQLAATNNTRCMVMLRTRFDADSYDEDLLHDKVIDLQSAQPYAVGYLFWKYSQRRRMLRHDFALASTKRASHVAVVHWSGDTPGLGLHVNSGYDNSVMFLTIL